MESQRRTLAKTLSWRVVAAVITGLIAWLMTGHWEVGLTFGLADSLVKFVVYYLHERAWANVRYGYRPSTSKS